MVRSSASRASILKVVIFAILFCAVGLSIYAEDQAKSQIPQKFVYLETGFFPPTEKVVIDLEAVKITYEFSHTSGGIGKEGYWLKELPPKVVKDVIASLNGFTAEQWQEHYSNPKVHDGVRWELEIVFTDGSTRKITGNNAWPKDFPRLCIKEIRGKAKLKESPNPKHPKNFHKVNDEMYRSGQPSATEMATLYTVEGIRSVLNLRKYHSDNDEIGELEIALYEFPLAAGSITGSDLVKILQIVKTAPKPILIHCWHGSDRTGTAIAACRIVFEGWSVEQAISEFMDRKYGHHEMIYKNLPQLLRNTDWEKIRNEVLFQEQIQE
ncbi:MAG: dual specificity protein phosphatase family protein [Kiritimatiellae bacterium]|nr:dual specificity protein phosphatase family protein [Kiritimatiellia bacterium]